MGLVIKVVATGLAVWVAVLIVDGLEFDGSFWAFVGVALILALINAIVKPIMKILSLPIIILSLGLFLLVINALALQLAIWLSGAWDLGLTSDGFFWSTFLGALVISIVSWLVGKVLDRDD